MEWIEEIAARVVCQRVYGSDGLAPFVEIGSDERDRLVALARGVETLAEVWEAAADKQPSDPISQAVADVVRNRVKELRGLLRGTNA